MAKKSHNAQQERLFQERLVPAEPGSGRLFDVSYDNEESRPVECLGMTFPNDAARHHYFTEKLRERLKDPEFRKIEGFPIGQDEDILIMSDPPYYTACPNPFMEDFVSTSRCDHTEEREYHKEPFSTDVSEGKTDGLYTAHAYHTKVPHKAIMRYILHYTEPGDIVLDGFCGSGMTGVAAQMCGCADTPFRNELEAERRAAEYPTPKWGHRKALLCDLSPVATFISSNYNLPVNLSQFEKEARHLLNTLRDDIGWMYRTSLKGKEDAGTINFTVWSEVFRCQECGGDVVFLEEGFDELTKKVRDSFPCPHCDAKLTKRSMERANDSGFDTSLNKVVQLPKRKPLLINYSANGNKGEKGLDQNDLALLERIAAAGNGKWFPTNRMMNVSDDVESWGDNWRSGTANFTHIHHIYLPRSRQALAALWEQANLATNPRMRSFLKYFVEQTVWGLSVLSRYAPSHFSQVNRYMSGLIRILSQHSECSPWYILEGKPPAYFVTSLAVNGQGRMRASRQAAARRCQLAITPLTTFLPILHSEIISLMAS